MIKIWKPVPPRDMHKAGDDVVEERSLILFINWCGRYS